MSDEPLVVPGLPLHPTNLEPGDPDSLLVRCPDCGQSELWTELELEEQGMCRAKGTCPICGA